MTTPKAADELFFRKEPPTDDEWVGLIERLREILKPRLRETRLTTLGEIRPWKTDWAGMESSVMGGSAPTIADGKPREDWSGNTDVRGFFRLEQIKAYYGQPGYVERGNPPFRVLSGGDDQTKQIREYVFWGINRDGHWMLITIQAELDQRNSSTWRNRFFRATHVKTKLVDSPVEIVKAMATMKSPWVHGLPGIWLALTEIIENLYGYACSRFKDIQGIREEMLREVAIVRGANATNWRMEVLF